MKPLLLYLALVGVPVAGLLGILHAGSALQAPPAIGGEWVMDTGAPGPAPGERLDLTQSGVYVSVLLAGSRLHGRLRGDTLVAERSAETDGRGGCDPRGAAVLRATVREGRMQGVLEPAGGPECAPLAFTAVRRPPAARGRGHP